MPFAKVHGKQNNKDKLKTKEWACHRITTKNYVNIRSSAIQSESQRRD